MRSWVFVQYHNTLLVGMFLKPIQISEEKMKRSMWFLLLTSFVLTFSFLATLQPATAASVQQTAPVHVGISANYSFDRIHARVDFGGLTDNTPFTLTVVTGNAIQNYGSGGDFCTNEYGIDGGLKQIDSHTSRFVGATVSWCSSQEHYKEIVYKPSQTGSYPLTISFEYEGQKWEEAFVVEVAEIVPSADLFVELIDAPEQVRQGDDYVVTYEYGNRGVDTAPSVDSKLEIPFGWDTILTDTAQTMAPGKKKVVTSTVGTRFAGTYVITATVSSSTSKDRTPFDNVVTRTVTVIPDFGLGSSSQGTVYSGGTFEFTVNLYSSSPVTETAQLTVNFPLETFARTVLIPAYDQINDQGGAISIEFTGAAPIVEIEQTIEISATASIQGYDGILETSVSVNVFPWDKIYLPMMLLNWPPAPTVGEPGVCPEPGDPGCDRLAAQQAAGQ